MFSLQDVHYSTVRGKVSSESGKALLWKVQGQTSDHETFLFFFVFQLAICISTPNSTEGLFFILCQKY